MNIHKAKHIQSTVLMLLILFIITVTGCARMNQAEDTDLILGTIINTRLYGKMPQKDLDAAANAAMDKARLLEQVFSVNIAGSELNYVNQNASEAPVTVSEDLFTVTERALYYANLTGGAFDPTLGRLIALWGIGTDHANVPDTKEIASMAGKKNYENVVLDANAHTIYFKTDNFSLDLGAIAKGYVADEMKRLLVEDYGITSALLNLGGNVITIGTKTDGSDWTLGIADPKNPEDTQNPAVLLKISGQTLVTSGNYQRYYDAPNGTRYHHILDGSTGYPAQSGTVSTTIITDCSMDADALSTAVYVLGPQKGAALIETLENTEAVFIDDDDRVTATAGIRDKLHEGSLSLNENSSARLNDQD